MAVQTVMCRIQKLDYARRLLLATMSSLSTSGLTSNTQAVTSDELRCELPSHGVTFSLRWRTKRAAATHALYGSLNCSSGWPRTHEYIGATSTRETPLRSTAAAAVWLVYRGHVVLVAQAVVI
jgi:hypothetical protein